MIRPLLVRGMLVGLVAGVLGFAFSYAFGGPYIERAIEFEEHALVIEHEPAGAELVTRGTQRTWGLLTGTTLIGIAYGGIFALVFAYAYGRIGQVGPRPTAALLALGAFVTIVLVPCTKYPPNPPAVGSPETLDERTALFLIVIAIAMLTAIAAGRLRRHLLGRMGTWNASILAVAAFVAVIALVELVLPSFDETPPGFPADVLYGFRMAALGLGALLWAVIGLGFGAAAERVIAGDPA